MLGRESSLAGNLSNHNDSLGAKRVQVPNHCTLKGHQPWEICRMLKLHFGMLIGFSPFFCTSFISGGDMGFLTFLVWHGRTGFCPATTRIWTFESTMVSNTRSLVADGCSQDFDFNKVSGCCNEAAIATIDPSLFSQLAKAQNAANNPNCEAQWHVMVWIEFNKRLEHEIETDLPKHTVLETIIVLSLIFQIAKHLPMAIDGATPFYEPTVLFPNLQYSIQYEWVQYVFYSFVFYSLAATSIFSQKLPTMLKTTPPLELFQPHLSPMLPAEGQGRCWNHGWRNKNCGASKIQKNIHI